MGCPHGESADTSKRRGRTEVGYPTLSVSSRQAAVQGADRHMLQDVEELLWERSVIGTNEDSRK